MSLEYAQVQNALNKIQQPLNDLVARYNPLLASMPKRAVSSDRIYLPGIMSTQHNPRAIADGSNVTISPSSQTNYYGAVLDWATYISEFSIPKRLLAQTAGQPDMLGNLLLSEIEHSAKDLADQIANDMFAGEVTHGIVGMQAVVADNNTYAGINRTVAANANWRSVVYDAVTTSGSTTTPLELSSAVLRKLDELFFERNKYGLLERPQRFIGVTTAAFMNRYQGLLTDVNINLTSGSVPAIQGNAITRGMLADFGGVVGFMGVPIVRNPNVSIPSTDLADTARIYFLDSEYWFLATLQSNPQAAQAHQVLGAQTAPTVDGLRFEVEVLSNTGETFNGYLKTYIQLVCTDPAKGGALIKNVDVIE